MDQVLVKLQTSYYLNKFCSIFVSEYFLNLTLKYITSFLTTSNYSFTFVPFYSDEFMIFSALNFINNSNLVSKFKKETFIAEDSFTLNL